MATAYPRNGLTKQQVTLKLTGGIDRKTDPKQLQNGQMYTCDNVQYTTEGQLRKRYGYTPLTPPGGLQGAPFAAVGCRDNVEPIVLGSGYLNRYNTATNLSTTIPANTQGRLAAMNVSASSGIGLTPSPPLNASQATDGQKYTFVTWEEIDGTSANIFYGVQDLVTGNWIISPVQLPLSSSATFTAGGATYAANIQCCPHALYNNGYFYLVLQFCGATTTGTTVYGAQVQAFALSLTNLSAGLLTTNLIIQLLSQSSTAQTAAPIYGWDVALSGGTFYVAYTNPNTAGSGYVQSYTVSAQTFTSVASGSFAGATPGNTTYQRLSIAVGTNTTYPLAITTNASVITMTSALVLRTRTDYNYPTTDAIAYPTATLWVGNVAYGFAITLAASGAYALYLGVIGVNPVTSTQTLAGNYPAPSTAVTTGIVSRPWSYNGKLYIWVFGSGFAGWGVFREQVLMEINPTTFGLNYIARTAYQSAGLTNQPYTMVPNDVSQIPNTNQFFTHMTQTTDVVGGTPATLGTSATQAVPAVVSNSFYGALSRTVFDFTPTSPTRIHNVPCGGVFVAGAFPLQYDGQALVEAGYSSAPEFTTAPNLPGNKVTVSNNDANGLIAAGTYTYYAVFCRRDAYGNIIRSSPSSPYIVTTTGTKNRVIFPQIYYSRAPGTQIEYYRTTLIAPLQPQLVGKTPNGTGFTDTLADASITSNPTLYTYSGEYPNDPPPAVFSMAVGETRAYIIPSDARNTIWCSKKFSPGRSIEWTTNLLLTEGGTHSGNFTAIAVLDTNVIVFKQDQILYFYGDGPDNAGSTGSFSAFQKLASDVGCIDPGSLAIIPAGLLFRSQRGIELLTRALQVTYVGFPVEPLAQSLTAISSATVMPQYQQVRFTSPIAGEPTLVYDYLSTRWSTYSGMNALSTANVLGNFWWISADGTKCNVETPGLFQDNGAFITMTIETPEIPSSAIQGWGRIYRIAILGEMKSSHLLTVSFAYDHQETYTNAIGYIAASSADTSTTTPYYNDVLCTQPTAYVTVPGPEQFRFSRVPRQVMQTLRLKLQDSPLTIYINSGTLSSSQLPYGESCAISNITLETGTKAILAKLPGSQTV